MQTINLLGKKARDGTLSIDEMAGGTFTISNGGVFGSMLSTPIINPPQSAILGMHATNMRPAVVGGQIVARCAAWAEGGGGGKGGALQWLTPERSAAVHAYTCTALVHPSHQHPAHPQTLTHTPFPL